MEKYRELNKKTLSTVIFDVCRLLPGRATSKIIMLPVDFGIALVTAIWKACNFMELHMAKSSQLPGSHLTWLLSKVSDLDELFHFQNNKWGEEAGEEGSTMILCTVKQVYVRKKLIRI